MGYDLKPALEHKPIRSTDGEERWTVEVVPASNQKRMEL